MPLNELITPAAAMMWIASRDEARTARFYRGAIEDKAMWVSLVIELQELRDSGRLQHNEAELLFIAPEFEAFDVIKKLEDAEADRLQRGEIKRRGYVDKSATVKVYQKLVKNGLRSGWKALRLDTGSLAAPTVWERLTPFAHSAEKDGILGLEPDCSLEFVMDSADIVRDYPLLSKAAIKSKKETLTDPELIRRVQARMTPRTRTQLKSVAREIVRELFGDNAASDRRQVESARSTLYSARIDLSER